jgi:hypothetical protein
VRARTARKASRPPGQPSHAPDGPAALSGASGPLVEQYQRCLAEWAVLVRPESGAGPRDWARLRRQRDRLEAALRRAQEAHQAAGPGLPRLYDFSPIMSVLARSPGLQEPARAPGGVRGDCP